MSTRSCIAVVALMLALGVGCTTTGPVPTRGTREDEEAIRKVIAEMTAGFNSHDARASTRMYMPDANLVTVRGERFLGTTEFEKGLASIFATRAREATHRTLNVSVRFIRPDVAVVHQLHVMSGKRHPDGTTLPPHQQISTRILVKEQGHWITTAFQNTDVESRVP